VAQLGARAGAATRAEIASVLTGSTPELAMAGVPTTNPAPGIVRMSGGEKVGAAEPAAPGGAATPGGKAPAAKAPRPDAQKASGGFVRDFATKNTKDFSARYGSPREARSLARTKLGRNPVQVEPGKLRSADGRWQYRGKPEDLAGHGPADSPHIHLEHLNPKTGEVLENWHLRWD
jgi:hypothetical protein